MRIVFVGTTEFSRHCLDQVLKNEGSVVGVITLAEADAGFHTDFAPLPEIAARYGINVNCIKNINDPVSIDLIRSLRPDYLFVFGWSQIIAKNILDIPTLGCVGTHPTLLPQNRGRHPIVWALVEGLEESGLTFFYMDEGADSGDILWQKPFPISLEDNARSVYEKVKELASEAILDFLPHLMQGSAPRTSQDHSQATYWRKRTEKDGEIQWAAPTMDTFNLIRALAHPYVGAHTFLRGERIRIWRAQLPKTDLPPDAIEMQPGAIFAETSNAFDVRTGDGYIRVHECEPQVENLLKVTTQLGD